MAEIIDFNEAKKRARKRTERIPDPGEMIELAALLFEMRDLMMLYCVQAMELIQRVPEED